MIDSTGESARAAMPIADTIRAQLTEALKGGDTLRRDTLRLLIASMNNARIAAQRELNDEDVLRVLQREAKQRRESIDEFRKGRREDLVAAEQAELDIISAYLPDEMSEEELREVVASVIEDVGASAPGDIGKVMGPLMQRLAGRADGRRANELVRERLAAG